jgi:iron complex transport system ATP-binding protein
MGETVPRLSCRGLALRIGGQTLCAGLDLDVNAGECFAVIGPNGAGKTTLIATLAGLRAPAAGTIAYDGVPLDGLNSRARALIRGWLAQDSVDHFPASALEIALAGRHPYLSRYAWESAADVECAHAALARFGMAEFALRDVRTLSGGERRRVALAALVAQAPRLMLLDEPSSHLDPGHQIAALDVLTAMARTEGRAIVMALHELHLAVRYADHVIALGQGQVAVGRAEEMLTAARLSELFRTPLVAAGDGRARTFVPA